MCGVGADDVDCGCMQGLQGMVVLVVLAAVQDADVVVCRAANAADLLAGLVLLACAHA